MSRLSDEPATPVRMAGSFVEGLRQQRGPNDVKAGRVGPAPPQARLRARSSMN